MTDRVVYTADELEALPFGSVVIASGGTARTKVRGNTVRPGAGWTTGDTAVISNAELADGRALWVIYERGETLPELLQYSQNLYNQRSKARLQHEAHFPTGYMPSCPVWGVWLDDPTDTFGSHRPFFEEGHTADEAIKHALDRYAIEGVRPMRGVAPFLANDTVRQTVLDHEGAAS